MSDIINVPMAQQRDIKTVTAEIRTLTIQGQRLALEYAIEIGRRLKEAKSMLAHGQWGPWLKEEVEFSQSTANNFMRIFDEYGADQISIFGAEAESKTLGNLPYTKALKLLAMPAEEREAFVEQNDVELSAFALAASAFSAISHACFFAASRSRIAASRSRIAAFRSRITASRSRIACSSSRLDDTLRDQLAEKEAKRRDLMTQIQHLERELEDAEAEAKAANVDETATAEREKEIREAAYKEAYDAYEAKKAEVAKEAEAAASEKAKAKEEKLKKQVAEKTRQVEEIRAEMDKLRKQLDMASPDTAQFKILFEAVQADFNRMLGLLLKIRQEDAERGQKLTKAVTTVLEAWGKQVTA